MNDGRCEILSADTTDAAQCVFLAKGHVGLYNSSQDLIKQLGVGS